MSESSNAMEYIRPLAQWMEGAAPYLYVSPERPDLTCYGTGDNNWGVQTNQKAFAAYAMLAVAPQLDTIQIGESREEIRETALRLLRYSLHSHIEGSYRCLDGTRWGHTWISALGIERMMHGAEAMEPFLTEQDRDLLRKVLISESDWLLQHYEIVAGLYSEQGKNKPESNLWNGALLHRTAAMYPDCAHAQQYKEKGSRFLINSISIPSDAQLAAIVDGVPVSQRHIGANFFESYALNHHGYLNVGYMVICLSNTAMLHFMYRMRGMTPPDALYHHVRELWQVVKGLIFPDGRLLRIGGDTRARYTYCQEYLIPVWLMARDLFGDDCSAMEKGWLQQVALEMEGNGDGTFFSHRGGKLAEQSPLYFTRLESDRAVALSMGAAWSAIAAQQTSEAADVSELAINKDSIEIQPAWHDAYHGAYLVRSEKRIASWVWESAEKPQGLCLPPSASGLAEWRENLAGHISGLGKISGQRLVHHNGKSFEGGFITWGQTICYTQGLIAEGRDEEDIVSSQLVCVVLPDDTHMIVLQYAKALNRRVFINTVKGLQLLIPNDVYNANQRRYYHSGGVHTLNGYGSKQETIALHSQWLNIDNQLGVLALYGTDGLHINKPGHRQIGMRKSLRFEEAEGTLYADEICGPIHFGLRSLDANQIILDTGYLLQAGRGHEYTKLSAASGAAIAMSGLSECVRGVRVQGAGGIHYVLLANFGVNAQEVELAVSGEVWEPAEQLQLMSESTGNLKMTLLAGEARLLQL